jgi:ABC-type phosphate transport system substrate-binding protein
MRFIQFLFVLATLSFCLAENVGTPAIKVIANPSINISEISREELNRIFLITKTSLQGSGHIEPVLEKNGQAHDVFLRDYIGRTDAALMTYYRSLVFTGKASLPRSFNSDPQVAAYIAKTKGAIGYVGADTVTPGVKTLKVK